MATIIEKEPCFIFYTRDYQEHSVIVDLLTLNYGHVSVLAQGVKNLQSPLKSLLQPFSPLTISMRKNRGDLFFLYECQLVGEPYSFQIPDLFCAIYINELLHYLYKSKESDPILFSSYLNALKSISNPQAQLKNLRIFELNLLSSLGYGLSANDCNGELLQDHDLYSLALGSGFVKVDPNFNVISNQAIYAPNHAYPSEQPEQFDNSFSAFKFPKRSYKSYSSNNGEHFEDSSSDGLMFSKSKVRGPKLQDFNQGYQAQNFNPSFANPNYEQEAFDFVTPPIRGDFLRAIINQQFDSKEVLAQAKLLTNGLLKNLLGDNVIQSRKLYQDYLALKKAQQQAELEAEQEAPENQTMVNSNAELATQAPSSNQVSDQAYNYASNQVDSQVDQQDVPDLSQANESVNLNRAENVDPMELEELERQAESEAKIELSSEQIAQKEQEILSTLEQTQSQTKKRRGRPKGSKNKPKSALSVQAGIEQAQNNDLSNEA